MEKSNSSTQNRFAAIDGLRGIAILMVTTLHLWLVGSPKIAVGHFSVSDLIANGGLGVSIFFSLSGFCLFYPMIRKGSFQVDWRNFYERRALRILPAYWLAVIVWFVLWGMSNHWDHWLPNLLAHLTFTHVLLINPYHTVNWVFWSLEAEVWFYLALRFLAPAFYRSPAKCWLLLAPICLAVKYLWKAHTGDPDGVPKFLMWAAQQSLLGQLCDFMAGMLAAWLIVKRPQVSTSTAKLMLLSGFLLFIVNPYIKIHAILIPVASFCLIMGCLGSPDWLLTRTIASPPLAGLGIVSYSVYLYNFSFSPILHHARLSDRCEPFGWYLLAFACVMLCGIAGYLIAEKPFLSLRSRLRRAATAPENAPTHPVEAPVR